LNNVVLIGRLTRDPELRYIPESQNAVATFTLAVDRPFSKEKQADFIRITVFGKQAENCERYLAKGRLTAVQGRIQTGSYKNKEGVTVYTTDVIAYRVEFLEWGDRAGSEYGFGLDNNQNKIAPEIPDGFQALDDDDDIPF
jgi:single-strand DNA-binding protein